MKLFGSGKNKKPGGGARPSEYDQWEPARGKKYDERDTEEDWEYSSGDTYEDYEDDEGVDDLIRGYARKKRKRRIIAGCVVLALVIGGFIGYSLLFREPPVNTEGPNTPVPPPTQNVNDGDDEPLGEEPAPTPTYDPNSPRKEGVYTFICVGSDDGFGNTDTIMVGMLDTKNGKLNIVSVPRDTLVNVPWAVKKVNSIYDLTLGPDATQEEKGAALIQGFKNIMGYTLDGYVVVSLEAFQDMVNIIGGVRFNVPFDMITQKQDEHIYMNIPAGDRVLNGYEALMVMRHREFYPDGDLGRIKTQQELLKAIAKQLLQPENIPKVNELARVFYDHVTTSYEINNLLWLAKEFMKLDADDITFMKMPGDEGPNVPSVTIPSGTYIAGGSYVNTDIDAWLEMLNEYVNPWKDEITREHLSMITYDKVTDTFHSTNGQFAQ